MNIETIILIGFILWMVVLILLLIAMIKIHSHEKKKKKNFLSKVKYNMKYQLKEFILQDQ